MSLEIKNRVQNSSLKTLDLDVFYPKMELVSFDIKPWLKNDLLVIEKDFREQLLIYLNGISSKIKQLLLQCSVDAIVPHWAYMLISSKLKSLNITNVIGNIKNLELLLIKQAVNNYDFSDYNNKPYNYQRLLRSKITTCLLFNCIRKVTAYCKEYYVW